MHVLADRVALGYRGDHGLAEVLRVRAREANALDAVDRVARAQQLAELGVDLGREVAAPRVDVLAEQRDLARRPPREARHLGEDLAGTAALLAAAHRRHDAVGALRVAAHRDLHPRLERALAVHRELGRERAVVETEAAARDAVPAGAEPLAEVRDRARARTRRRRRVELEDALALRLGVAAADGDHAVGVARASAPRPRPGRRRASCPASRGSCRC